MSVKKAKRSDSNTRCVKQLKARVVRCVARWKRNRARQLWSIVLAWILMVVGFNVLMAGLLIPDVKLALLGIMGVLLCARTLDN